MQDPEPLTMDTKLKQGEESENGARQTDLMEEVEPNRQRHSWDWAAVMEGSEGLSYDDPWSDSDAMVMGTDCPQGLCHRLTPRVMQPRICRGHQWTDCCQWRWQSLWKCM